MILPGHWLLVRHILGSLMLACWVSKLARSVAALPSDSSARHLGRRPWHAGRCVGAAWLPAVALLLAIIVATLIPGRLFAGTPLARTPRLTAIEATDNGAVSTLSLSLSQPVAYQVYTLENPDRIVIDLPEIKLAAASVPHDIGLIGTIRTGRPSAGSSRLVIDTTEPVLAEAQLRPAQIGGGHLLNISLKSGAGRRTDPAAVAVLPAKATGRFAATGWTASPPHRPTPTGQRKATDFAAEVGRLSTRLQSGGERKVVVLDPGHGGQDPGAMMSGLMEKTITLATARELRRALEAIGGYRVVLTRNSDKFIPLRQRIAIARNAGADVMVSLHANKLDNPSIRGLSVYTLSESASDSEAAALAELENKADLITHLDLRGATPEVTNILIDLSQRNTMNNSVRLASLVVDKVRPDAPLLVRPHRFAGFAVLKAPDVPSILVELGFLSNKDDRSAIASSDGRRKLVRALARAIDAYFVPVEMATRR